MIVFDWLQVTVAAYPASILVLLSVYILYYKLLYLYTPFSQGVKLYFIYGAHFVRRLEVKSCKDR